MASSVLNTKAFEESVEKEKSVRTLEKAKEIEKKKLRQGWRYVKVNQRLTAFVPCDKNGEPTEAGKQQIYNLLNS